MARRRNRRSSRKPNSSDTRTNVVGGITGALAAAVESSRVPEVLVGAVNGLETVAVGALQLARNVLVSAVSGAADVGAEAVTATLAGARGVVAATSRMVADIATTAQTTVQETVMNARRSRNGAAGRGPSKRALTAKESTAAEAAEGTNSSAEQAAPRRRGPRQPRTSVAA